jgi:predicted transcriptional regulator of viral defense system
VKQLEYSLEAYISREIPNIFKDYSLLAVNEVLPGQIKADFHLKDKDGNDVFVEVKGSKIGRKQLTQIINMYAAISNIEPPLKNFNLLIIAPEVNPTVRKELKKLPVKLLDYKQIGITEQKLHELKRQGIQEHNSQKLSPEEARLVAKWESENKTTIRASDVQETLDCSIEYAHYLLHNLEQKNWLERVTSGLYQFIPLSYGYPERVPPSNSFIIGASLIKPYYFSYYTSNSHYGFTTQMPYTLFIATTKKKPEITWEGTTFKFITLSKRKFFGYKKEQIFDTQVLMAEPEKSLVDSFDKPKYTGGTEHLAGILWRALPRVKQEKLVNYAIRMKSHSLIQRIGFLIDFLENEKLTKPFSQPLKDKLSEHVGKTTIYLDSKKPKKGKLSKEWNIINNVPRERLLSEIEVR